MLEKIEFPLLQTLRITWSSCNLGGFQLEFVSISRVINHMNCYKFECSHWLKLQHSNWRANFVKDFYCEKKLF